MRKEASLTYIIRKSAELNINLRLNFVRHDENQLSVLPRQLFFRVLDNLPLGLSIEELEEVFDHDLNFDNYGNVDYTVILNSDLFVQHEKQRLRIKNRGLNDTTLSLGLNESDDIDKVTDNRKVVVEDLLYIDDLEIIVYTILAPMSSNIFVSHTKKWQKLTDDFDPVN